MTPEIQKQILDKIDALSQKLGIAASYLWALYVRQQYINGIENFIVMLAAAYGSYRLYKLIDPLWKRELGYLELNMAGSLSIVGTIATAVIAIVALVNGIDCLANAQLQAFKDIINTIK